MGTAVRFDAVEVRPVGDDVGHLTFWCPWCEALHYHGACGGDGKGDGHRAAHCSGDRQSPLIEDGVELRTARKAGTHKAAQPDALMIEGPPLRSMLDHFGGEYRALALQSLLGSSPSKSRQPLVLRAFKGRGTVEILGIKAWRFIPLKGAQLARGGFLRR